MFGSGSVRQFTMIGGAQFERRHDLWYQWRGSVDNRVGSPITAKDYGWVNARQIRGVGTVNFATGRIRIDASMQWR